MNITAHWDPLRKRVKYYWGFQVKCFVGSSHIDEKGVFIMSETLKKFVLKQLPMIIEYNKNVKSFAEVLAK